MATPRLCSVDGCGKLVIARGWCNAHWTRWRRHGDPLAGGPFYGRPATYLREVVLPLREERCLFWPFARAGNGYAMIRINGRAVLVHRLVCEDIAGPAPFPGAEAAHSCGNGHLGCVSPTHLSWKTHSENMADKIGHGTSSRSNPRTSDKLTPDDVLTIRSLRKTKTCQEVADQFGISDSYVSQIANRRRWGWLD